MRHPTHHDRTTSDLPFDRTTLTVATLASVLAAMVTSALGSGFLAPLVSAVLVPAVTAFLVHPGPHRRRRVTAVLTLVMLLRGGREAVASERRDSARPAAGRSRIGTAFNASVAIVFGVVLLTLVELVLGHAALADRRLTLIPGGTNAGVAQAHEDPRPVSSGPKRRVVRAAPAAGTRGRSSAKAPAGNESSRPVPRPDRVRPELDLPADVTVDAQGPGGARVTYRVTATDGKDGAVTATCVPPPGSRFAVGTTVVRCSATDRAGNAARGSFTVLVRDVPDVVPPRLALPDRLERDTADASGMVVAYAATAVDRRDGPVAVECAPPSGSRFPVGRTIVRCVAADRAGNAARGAFAVHVRAVPVDVVPPRLDLPDGVARQAADRSGVVVDYTAAAVDDRDGPVATKCSPASGSHFSVGRTDVSCTATDRAGNVAHGGFTVSVGAPADTVPPRLSLPRGLTRETTDSSGMAVKYAARAIDDRDGPVAVECAPSSGSWFAVGTTTVRCSAADRAGNVATGEFDVDVALVEP